MSNGTSFEDYVNAYYGGTLGISKRYGIEKSATELTTADADYFNVMFGAAVSGFILGLFYYLVKLVEKRRKNERRNKLFRKINR